MRMFIANKVIIKTALITFFACLLALIISVISISLLNPKIMANFTDTLGLNSISLKYRVLAYNKSEDITDLYFVVGESINQSNYEYVEKYFPVLLESSDYEDFTSYIEELNLSRASTNTLKLYVANEDNYLKSAYVTALYKLNNKQEAFDFALNDLVSNYDNTEKFNFVMSAFAVLYAGDSGRQINIFDQYVTELNLNANEVIENYYNELQTLYAETESGNRLYLSLLLKNIISVCDAMLLIDQYYGADYDEVVLLEQRTNYSQQLDILLAD